MTLKILTQCEAFPGCLTAKIITDFGYAGVLHLVEEHRCYEAARKTWVLPCTGLHSPAYTCGYREVSAPLCLAHVRPHLDAVSDLGPTVQDSLQQTGASPAETTKMVQGPEEMMDGERLKDTGKEKT